MKKLLTLALLTSTYALLANHARADECEDAGKAAGELSAQQFIDVTRVQQQFTYTEQRQHYAPQDQDARCLAALTKACRRAMWQSLYQAGDVLAAVQDVSSRSFAKWQETMTLGCSEQRPEEWGSQRHCPVGASAAGAKFCASQDTNYVVMDEQAWQITSIVYEYGAAEALYQLRGPNGSIVIAKYAQLSFVVKDDLSTGPTDSAPIEDWTIPEPTGFY